MGKAKTTLGVAGSYGELTFVANVLLLRLWNVRIRASLLFCVSAIDGLGSFGC